MLLGMMAARLMALLASEYVFESFHGREYRGGDGNPAGGRDQQESGWLEHGPWRRSLGLLGEWPLLPLLLFLLSSCLGWKGVG
jgi:hypothetical protein